MLQQNTSIDSRFLRSIRIDKDFFDMTILENIVCPSAWKNALQTMAQHLTNSHQGAFTWTAPYGSGKSAFAIAFKALLNDDKKIKDKAIKILVTISRIVFIKNLAQKAGALFLL